MFDRHYYYELSKDAVDNLESYKKEALGHVSRWEYATSKKVDLAPFWFERHNEKRGRTAVNGFIGYGFDSAGTIRVSKDVYRSQIYGYRSVSDQKILERTYVDDTIDSIQELTLEDNRPVRLVECRLRHGIEPLFCTYREERYFYEGDRIAAIERTDYSGFGHPGNEATYRIYYTEGGKLRQIDRDGKTVYMLLSASEAARMREEIRERLLEASKRIPGRIGELTGGNPLCFLSIYLDDEYGLDGMADPVFQPGFESVRAEQLAKKDAFEPLWHAGEHPAEHRIFLDDQELSGRFLTLLRYWQSKGDWWKKGRELWYEVALELNSMDWSSRLRVTEDFVIFVDEEAINFKRDLVKSLPAHKQAMLRDKGLL